MFVNFGQYSTVGEEPIGVVDPQIAVVRFIRVVVCCVCLVLFGCCLLNLFGVFFGLLLLHLFCFDSGNILDNFTYLCLHKFIIFSENRLLLDLVTLHFDEFVSQLLLLRAALDFFVALE